MKVSDGTPGLQGQWFIHNTIGAQQIVLVRKYQMGPLVYKASDSGSMNSLSIKVHVSDWTPGLQGEWFIQNSGSKNSLSMKHYSQPSLIFFPSWDLYATEMEGHSSGIFLRFWSRGQRPVEYRKISFGPSKLRKLDAVQKKWTTILNWLKTLAV